MFNDHEVTDMNPVHLNNNGIHNAPYLEAVPALIKIMKEEKSWKKGDLNTMVLLREPDKKVILTVLHERTEIKSFQSDDSVTFHVLEGKLQLHIRGGSVTVNSGEVLTMNEKTRYSFDTPEETAFLMTMQAGV